MEPLSQREFDSWRKTDDEFKRRVLDHVDDQTKRNLEIEGRMTSVESGELRNKRVSISSVVAAIITAALAALSTYAGTK